MRKRFTLEKELEKVKAELYRYETDILPLKFGEAGIRELRLDDGSIVTSAVKTYASIKAENSVAAHNWLRENGFGDMIKNEIKVALDKERDAEAQDLIGILETKELPYIRKEFVHPMTYTAWARSQLADGNVTLPMDLLGIFTKEEASFKESKK